MEVRIHAVRQPGQSLQAALAEVAVLGVEQLERAHSAVNRGSAALTPRPVEPLPPADGPEAVEIER